MPVTIKDIARAAGVSHTTVSRALNGNSLIPESTASAIRELARQMGYVPSAAARGLRTNRSRAIGVIVSRIDNPYFGEVVQGIEEALQGAGYSIFVASSYLDYGHEHSIVQAFGEHRVDGVIIGSVTFNREHAEILKGYGVPVVVVNNQSPRQYANAIAHDDVYGAREVTAHLIGLGHRRIAYLGNRQATRINGERLRGYRLACEENGLTPDPGLVLLSDGSEIENGESAMEELFKLPQLPDAVFCFNDLMAIGALKTLKRRGVDVPRQLSLAGFDNIPYSAYTSPALTTFDQPKLRIGFEAASLLLELINNGNGSNGNRSTTTLRIRGELLVRESTAENHNKEIA